MKLIQSSSCVTTNSPRFAIIGFDEEVLAFLEDAITDRILAVQQAARQARDKWLEFENLYVAIEEK